MEENNKENNLQDIIDYFEKTLKIKEFKCKKNEKKEDILDIDRGGKFYEAFEKNKKDTEYMILLFGIQQVEYLQVGKKLYKREDIISGLVNFYSKELKTKYKEELEKLKTIKEKEKELETLKEKEAELKNLKEKLAKEFKNLKEKIAKEDTELGQELKTIKEKEKELETLKEKEKELETLKEKEKELETLKEKEAELKNLKEQLNEFQEENEKLKEQLNNLQKNNEDTESKILEETNSFYGKVNSKNLKKKRSSKEKNKSIQNYQDNVLDKDKNNNLNLKKSEHKIGKFIKNAAKHYNLNGGAKMAIEKLMGDLENAKGDKKERDKIWQEFANNKSSHLYTKKSRLNELLKAIGTIKSAKHLFEQEGDEFEKANGKIDGEDILVNKYKYILELLSNNDAIQKTYDGEVLWTSSIVDAIRPELEELKNRVLKDEQEKEAQDFEESLKEVKNKINEFMNKFPDDKIKEEEKEDEEESKKEEANSNMSYYQEEREKEEANRNMSYYQEEREKGNVDKSNNKEKQNYVQNLKSLEEQLDQVKNKLNSKPEKIENNKNDEAKDELEKIEKNENLEKIKKYKKQIAKLEKVAERIDKNNKNSEMSEKDGEHLKDNKIDEMKQISGKPEYDKIRKILLKQDRDIDCVRLRDNVMVRSGGKNFIVTAEEDKRLNALTQKVVDVINISNGIEEYYKDNNKKPNNTLSNMSLYEISRSIISKLLNMGQDYGM